MTYSTIATIHNGIPGTRVRATTLLREPVKPDRNQMELFRRTCGPDEYESWTVGTLEIMEMIVSRQGYAYPSDVYAACCVQPYDSSWWGAFWRGTAKKAGYKMDFPKAQKSPTPEAHGRIEIAWRKK
jgi:hypothetical protein